MHRMHQKTVIFSTHYLRVLIHICLISDVMQMAFLAMLSASMYGVLSQPPHFTCFRYLQNYLPSEISYTSQQTLTLRLGN